MAELLQVIRADAHRGEGTPAEPYRVTTQYWTTDGQLLVEHDHLRIVQLCDNCRNWSSFDGTQAQCFICQSAEVARQKEYRSTDEKRARETLRKVEHDRDTLLTASQKDADEIARLKGEVSKCGHTITAQQDERAKLRAIIERLEAMQRVGTIAARELTENQRRRVRRQLRKVKSTVTLSDML